MRLTGLDFETANYYDGSICAAGCAHVEDGVVTVRHEWLVCPHVGYRWMLPQFTEIHGLRFTDVCHCGEFPTIWPEMRRMLQESDCVVIHNAPFDLRHLRAVLGLYGLEPVEFDYADSLTISRRLLPELPRHSLDRVADHFNIVFQHHDALEDAIACATIVSRLGIPADARRHFTINP